MIDRKCQSEEAKHGIQILCFLLKVSGVDRLFGKGFAALSDRHI